MDDAPSLRGKRATQADPFAAITVAAGQFVLTRTVFGRYIVATGTNEEAVRLCGINTKRIRVIAFMLARGLASVASVVHTSRLAAADPNAGLAQMGALPSQPSDSSQDLLS